MDGPDSEHYASTPGLELVKGVLSHAAAVGRNKGHIVAVVDVRRAYFHAEPLPKTFGELLDCYDLDTRTRCCGRLRDETGCKVVATCKRARKRSGCGMVMMMMTSSSREVHCR